MSVIKYVFVGIGAALVLGFAMLILLANRAEAHRKWGYIDTSGREVIPIRFDESEDFSQGLAAVQLEGAWGFVDREGRFVSAPTFDRLDRYSPSGLAAAQVDGAIGYIHLDGSWSITPRFHRAYGHDGSRGLAGMVVGRTTTRISGSMGQPIHSFGLIGRAGEWIVAPLDDTNPRYWSSGGDFSEGLCAVQVGGGEFGYIDGSGSMAIPPRFDQAGTFIDGLALVKPADGGYALIDRTGAEVLSLNVSLAVRGRDGFLTVLGSLGDQEGYYLVDVFGAIHGGPYDDASTWSEGRLPVEIEGDWVLVDAEGNRYGEAWDTMEAVSEGFAAVGRSGAGFFSDYEWGFIDTRGTVVISPLYNRAGPFQNGRARVAMKE